MVARAPLHLLLALFFSLSSSFSSSSPDPPSLFDEAALLSFKASVSVDPEGLLSGWDPAVHHICEWAGVSCDYASGRVTSLSITGTSSSALVGELPASIENLTELRVLSLRHNAFAGEILAKAVGALRHLEVLDFHGNNFSGMLPGDIMRLPSLRVLDLSDNSLTGDIPADLFFSRLETVDLSFNQLSGKIGIGPSSSCRLLSHLKLSGNLLVDRIPPEIGRCVKIRTLLLDRNILEGRIPAEIGELPELRILDVSRNSLTDSIPRELANCSKLSALVLTNVDSSSADGLTWGSNVDEFNAFVGSIPPEIFSVPGLEILWAPRANVGGRLPSSHNGSCSLRILNLGQNYVSGAIPGWLGMCRNLSFLDLSSNYLQGDLPASLGISCMTYFNVSQNLLSGPLFNFSQIGCSHSLVADGWNGDFLDEQTLLHEYSMNLPYAAQKSNMPGSIFVNDSFVVLHDFSWNYFTGSLPSFIFPVGIMSPYGLYLNNNGFNGSLSSELFGPCQKGSGFAVNLSVNQIQGGIEMLSDCIMLKRFEAANNQLHGSMPSDIGRLHWLKHLDIRRNFLGGSIPSDLRGMVTLEVVLLSKNNLSGEIPLQIDELASLTVLDLSTNSLTGTIPSSLAKLTNLESLLLDHNQLSGVIPPSFSTLHQLVKLDVSFNNLSGDIPHLNHSIDCKFFLGNSFLPPCPDSNASSQFGAPFQTDISNCDRHKSPLKSFTIAAVASAAVIVSVLLMLLMLLASGKRKLVRVVSHRKKVVVTFADAPAELSYDNVVKATGNFNIQNLIGTGGFGATYKGELVPGFLVAVKRLSMGKFQGFQQFDAEIRTLGRIRHRNLVTLIGYHMGEIDTFLIYNYLSGGNLEAFICNMPHRNISWHEVHRIALDVAQALSYLHYSCAPRIIHRDIKPSNILLDEKLNAYLSEFGLARLLEVSQTHATTDVAGTFGYVAPEYATTCRVSDKADVYSFGVVLLELLSGKRSLDPSFSEYGNGFTIVAWGRLLIQEGRAGELFSRVIWETGPRDKLVELLRLVLDCTGESLSVRPSMKQVVLVLKQLKN